MQKVGPRVYAYSAPSRTRAARSSCTPKPPPGHRKWPDPGSCPEVPPAPLRAGTSRPWRHRLRTADYIAPLSVRNPVPRAPHAPRVPAAAIDSPSHGRRRYHHRRRRRRRSRGIPASAAVAAVPSRRARPPGGNSRAHSGREGRPSLPPHTEVEPEHRGTRVCFRKQPNVLPREWSAAVCHETAEGGRKRPRATESGERSRGCGASREAVEGIRKHSKARGSENSQAQPGGTASARSEAGGPDSVLRHLSRSEEPNYDSGFVFYEVVKLQHRGAYLERTERPQIQV